MRIERIQDEYRLLQSAIGFHGWRWRAERKRLVRRGVTHPVDLHFAEQQCLHRVWIELREQAGLPEWIPRRVMKARDEISYRRWRRLVERYA